MTALTNILPSPFTLRLSSRTVGSFVEWSVPELKPISGPAPPAPTGDAALIARLRTGDDAAFEELLRTLGPRLLSVARKMMGSEDDAADVFQDAMLSAFKSINAFDGKSLLSTWLHRIVVNAALMKMRTRRRHPETSIEKLLPTFESDGHHAQSIRRWKTPAGPETPEGVLKLVRTKIDELPADYREVLMLRDVQELDTQQTAEVLSISTNAVKTRLHRARLALRALLDPVMTAGTLAGFSTRNADSAKEGRA